MAKGKGGRPKIPYTTEMAKAICKAVSTSTDPIRTILKTNPDWPSEDTIRDWRFDYIEFSVMYADAKRLQAELFAEEIIHISDDSSQDYKIDSKGNQVVDFENIQRSRLRVDSRKWLAGKLAGKLYGDKSVVEQHIINHEASIKELE